MSFAAPSTGPLRDREAEGAQRVTPMELFFDLVYVFAVTQLSHLLLQDLTWRGALHTALLLLAVWWAWIYTTWITNWFDPNYRGTRLMLFAVMLVSLLMSATIPDAFGDAGLYFAGAYAAIQIGRCIWAVMQLGSDPSLRTNFQRILIWCTVAAALWIAGGFAEGTSRELIWLTAILIDYAAPAAGFYTPGMGRSATTDWNISGEHMAERCQLFVIIALGESILVTGATFSGLDHTAAATTALVVAFIGSVAFWWIYFDRAAERSSERIAASRDPGRLGRSAYTYFHLPIVAGIIVTAVGDELVIAHPTGHAANAAVIAVLFGPTLFLAGHALFKWVVFRVISTARVVAIALLAALAPFGTHISPLLLAAGATAIVIMVAVWDTILERKAALPAQSTS